MQCNGIRAISWVCVNVFFLLLLSRRAHVLVCVDSTVRQDTVRLFRKLCDHERANTLSPRTLLYKSASMALQTKRTV